MAGPDKTSTYTPKANPARSKTGGRGSSLPGGSRVVNRQAKTPTPKMPATPMPGGRAMPKAQKPVNPRAGRVKL